MGCAVGICIHADHQVGAFAGIAEPAECISGVTTQVDAQGAVGIHRRGHTARSALSLGADPIPDPIQGQVDREYVDPPAQ